MNRPLTRAVSLCLGCLLTSNISGKGEIVGPPDEFGYASCLGGTLLYMIVEKFRNQDPVPVYRRFQEQGRLAPDGLLYVSSWVDVKLERCFQLMETDRPELVDEWLANWSDLVDFEVYPIMSSPEAAAKVALRF